MDVLCGGLASVSEHKLSMMPVLSAGWDDRARVTWRVESVVRRSDRVEIEEMMLDAPARHAVRLQGILELHKEPVQGRIVTAPRLSCSQSDSAWWATAQPGCASLGEKEEQNV